MKIKQRLQTEAKISAHLHHLISLKFLGEFWNDIVPYLEMEFIDGFSLKDLLRHHKQVHSLCPVTRLFRLQRPAIMPITRSLRSTASLHGVVHRDIKPANISLRETAPSNLRISGSQNPPTSASIPSGQKGHGHVYLLKPEQLNGDVLDCRWRHLFAGTVIYEIIAAKRRFPRKPWLSSCRKKCSTITGPLIRSRRHSRALCTILEKSMELNREKDS